MALSFYIFLFTVANSLISTTNNILTDSTYPEFVEYLKNNYNTSKFINFVDDLNKTSCTTIQIPARYLIPTQQEIDIEKSVKTILEDYDLLDECLSTTHPVFPANIAKIVISANKYIIDGHHRWAQVFLVNRYYKLPALNIEIEDPIVALKMTQVGIFLDSNYITENIISGRNIFNITENDFIAEVRNYVTSKTLDIFSKNTNLENADMVINHLWKNLELMKKYNPPIPGAYNRNIMPQTHYSKNWCNFIPLALEH